MAKSYVSLGNMKKVREKLGIKQADLAEAIGCHIRTLQRYESGKMRAPRGVAECMAYHLGVVLEDIAAPAVEADPDPERSTSRTSGSVEGDVLERRLENLKRIESRLLSVLESLEAALKAALEKPEKKTLLDRIFS